MRNAKTLKLTQLALLIALSAVLALTPIGFIMIPPISITVMHIPTIVGAIVMGPTYGAIIGLSFGFFSMLKATFAATSPLDMLFSPFISETPIQSFILCIVPRILLGVIAAYLFIWLSKKMKNRALAIGISAAVATAAHTFMVLGLLSTLFNAFPFMTLFQTLTVFNGSLEALAAVIVAVGVCRPLLKILASKR